MYAWKDFDRDDPIGKYSGKVIGEFHAEDSKGRERVVRQYGGSGTPEYLCEIDVEGGRKVQIIDAAAAGPPFLQRANDSRGLTNGRGGKLYNTAVMDPDGRLRSLRKARRAAGRAAPWAHPQPEGGWEQIVQREILWAYGPAYWAEREEPSAPSSRESDRSGAPSEPAHATQTAGKIARPTAAPDTDTSAKRSQQTGAESAQSRKGKAMGKLAGYVTYDEGMGTALLLQRRTQVRIAYLV